MDKACVHMESFLQAMWPCTLTHLRHFCRDPWQLCAPSGGAKNCKNVLTARYFLDVSTVLLRTHSCPFSELFADTKGAILTSPSPFLFLSYRCAGEAEKGEAITKSKGISWARLSP